MPTPSKPITPAGKKKDSKLNPEADSEIKRLLAKKMSLMKQMSSETLSQEEEQVLRDKILFIGGEIEALKGVGESYSDRQQMNIRISSFLAEKLDEICSYWIKNPTNQHLDFLGNSFDEKDLKSRIALATRLLTSSIRALATDVENQKYIDSIAMRIYTKYLCTGSNKDTEFIKNDCYDWAKKNWFGSEAEELFELIWPIALDRAGILINEDANEIDYELEDRKMQLKLFRGNSIRSHQAKQ